MLEISRTAVAEGDDEIELTLDLSIGGSYGKSQKNEEEKRGNEIMVPRSGFSFSETSGNDLENMSGLEAMDSKRKREIQALRRQEARKKREEKMRKSGAICRKIPNGSSAILSANADDKLQLKLQQFKAKTHERETRENELAALLQSARKNDEFSAKNSVKESMQQKQNSCRKERQRQQAMSNEFLERSSSVVSDHPSTSVKGGSSSEYLKADELHLRASATSGQSDKPNENDTSSSSKETDRATRISRLGVPSPKASKTTSASNVQGGNHGMDSLATMPCVSTTGNGPSGKTINGFLYRYSKTEVSIVCVCHGKSHTPAEFVEHAGGVDVTNPLRHITMIPSSFG